MKQRLGPSSLSANVPVVLDSCATGIVIQKVKLKKRGRADMDEKVTMKLKLTDRKTERMREKKAKDILRKEESCYNLLSY